MMSIFYSFTGESMNIIMSDENSAGNTFISECYPLNAAECNIKF